MYYTSLVNLDVKLKEKFSQSSSFNFNNLYLLKEAYNTLHDHALFNSSLFNSIYICEQFFLRIKITKSKNRFTILDKHLERIATTSIDPDIDSLLSQKSKLKLYISFIVVLKCFYSFNHI